MMDPSGTVFISGAAGGLGSALAGEFSQKSYQVIATDIDEAGLARLKGHDHVITRKLDVTDDESVRSTVKELGLENTGLDVLVCLAGVYDSFPVTEEDPVMFKKIMEVNFLGTASLVQGLIRPLIRNKGRVVVVSSESYKIQAMFQPYMISKAALESYCRVARQELALKGIRMIIVRPGAIRTPLLDWMKTGPGREKYPLFREEFTKSYEKSLKMVGKISPPESVARRIFLASTISKPKRIYRINNDPFISLISLLPVKIFDRIAVRTFRTKK